MDSAEVEETLFATSDVKLHGGMCKKLSVIYCKVLGIFPILEAARPRSTSGIQALCSLHVALEKAKNILQHCCSCSKLYLAITGDSVLLKFEKARSSLQDSLQRVEDIVPQSTGYQVAEIVSELEGVEFFLDPSEKLVGDEIIVLLQQGIKFNSNSNENNELESFHQAASKLGITSSRAALRERRALKKLIERARTEEDKRKESIIAYLLHLMRKYSKLFRSDISDDNDSQGSNPCSPTVESSFEDFNGHAFERHLSKLSSFNFKQNNNNRGSGQTPLPPEELRCPISLQLMYDPAIISSGQTYERVCIEKWFSDGHSTCPKTQQKLAHLFLTPNYCVKGLVASWCEQNGIPPPDGPPESLDFNYWRLALSESESTNSSIRSSKSKGVKVVPLEEKGGSFIEGNRENIFGSELTTIFERYDKFLAVMNEEGENLRRKCQVVELIRSMLKDDEEARSFMGANGFVEALVRFLQLAVSQGNQIAQEIGSFALFNIAVNNNRNKEKMLEAGVMSLLEKMIPNSKSQGSATALYLNLSCLEEAKPIICSSHAVLFLVQLLVSTTEPQCKLDALHTLYNLSTYAPNIPHLLSAGIINGLYALIKETEENTCAEKSIAVLINLASNATARDQIISTPGLISGLSAILDTGEPIEQEQATSCLLILCNRNEKCSQMVLQEGVIPSLVSISVNGTVRGKEKAQKLLIHFREQRQRDLSSPIEEPNQGPECSDVAVPAPEVKPLCKLTSSRKMRGWSSIWKKKNQSVSQC